MKSMRASAFKTHCLTVMDRVKKTGEPVVVTKRGVPVVKVVPVESKNDDLFGYMAGEAKITGDIESPAVPLKHWKVLRK